MSAGDGAKGYRYYDWAFITLPTALVIAAHAFLAAATTISTTSPDGLIDITVNELCRLLHALVIESVRRVADVIAWSIFPTPTPSHRKDRLLRRQALTEP